MIKLISGEDAKLAWANGKQIELKPKIAKYWLTEIEDMPISVFDSDCYEFRLKPRTITLNGIEVPTPFELKRGDTFYYLDSTVDNGYSYMSWGSEYFMTYSSFGAWRTEEEVKQVVAALRSVFKGD